MTGNCECCGKYGDLDCDHVKTRGSGGNDDDFNIWLVCRLCHIKRHSKGIVWMFENIPACKHVLTTKGWELSDNLGRKRLIRK